MYYAAIPIVIEIAAMEKGKQCNRSSKKRKSWQSLISHESTLCRPSNQYQKQLGESGNVNFHIGLSFLITDKGTQNSGYSSLVERKMEPRSRLSDNRGVDDAWWHGKGQSMKLPFGTKSSAHKRVVEESM